MAQNSINNAVIGNFSATSGDVNISADATASTVNVGTGAAAKTVTLGSTNSTSSLDLQYGTGGCTGYSATGDIISAQDTGEINYPLQPAFLAYVNSTISGVTGDGTAYTVVMNTEVFDQGGDYNNGTGVFTAPVTGRYHFSAGVQWSSLTASNTVGALVYVASNRSVRSTTLSTAAGTPTSLVVNGSTYMDMDAGDIISLETTVSGEATKNVAIAGLSSGVTRSSWGGKLVC